MSYSLKLAPDNPCNTFLSIIDFIASYKAGVFSNIFGASDNTYCSNLIISNSSSFLAFLSLNLLVSIKSEISKVLSTTVKIWYIISKKGIAQQYLVPAGASNLTSTVGIDNSTGPLMLFGCFMIVT